jgi:hypothetical protein
VVSVRRLRQPADPGALSPPASARGTGGPDRKLGPDTVRTGPGAERLSAPRHEYDPIAAARASASGPLGILPRLSGPRSSHPADGAWLCLTTRFAGCAGLMQRGCTSPPASALGVHQEPLSVGPYLWQEALRHPALARRGEDQFMGQASGALVDEEPHRRSDLVHVRQRFTWLP